MRLPLIFFTGQVDKNHRAYKDEELEQVLESAFKHTDINEDGYIDYLEYRLSNFMAKKNKEAKPSTVESTNTAK